MSGTNLIIFAFGFWVMLMLGIGLFITAGSFHNINKHPENYTKNPFLRKVPIKERNDSER